MDTSIFSFPVTVYGNMEKFNEVLSKARCRVFYKGGNRNGTYITDEFAEQLIQTFAYVPLKGIWDEEAGDFLDHGKARSQGKIYGIVPQETNFAWEDHLDKDGVTRTYACVDVLIFSALYPESEKIIGAPQSMELFKPSIKFHKEYKENSLWTVFEGGCFLGLQALGQNVEPCFEGAAFYTMKEQTQEVVDKITQLIETYNTIGGQPTMQMNFKLSDAQKYNAIWALLNSEFTEENDWAQTYSLCDVYDDYALAYNFVENCYERIYYTKNDEEDSLVINKKQRCYILDVSEAEKDVLEQLRTLNNGTYDLVNPTLTNAVENEAKVATLTEENSQFSVKIEELSNENTTLNTEKANVEGLYTEAQATIATLNSDLDALKSYKKDIETKEKETVLGQYTALLKPEVIDAYRSKLDEFSALDLDKELSYELKCANISVFTNATDNGLVPTAKTYTGIEAILSKYKK